MKASLQLGALFSRHVEYVSSPMDYDGRDRTFRIFQAPVGDQLPLIHCYRQWAGREEFERDIGGTPVFIFTKEAHHG